MSSYHTSVLLKESIDALCIKPSGIYVDATFGGGGHTAEILSRLDGDGRVIAIDKDTDALGNAPEDSRVKVIHGDFRFVYNFVRYLGFGQADGIIADLGVSSHQFDSASRGFSFRFDSVIDMRMNTMSGKSAKDILNKAGEEELENIFRTYGELENSRRIASLICKARESSPIESTYGLDKAIESLIPKINGHKFLAKVYQALRMEVNAETASLSHFLEGSLRALRQGGRLAVITYHSIEDRMVKNFMKTGNTAGKEEKDFYGNSEKRIRPVIRKPVVPSEKEIAENTRARSAKLRIAEKTGS